MSVSEIGFCVFVRKRIIWTVASDIALELKYLNTDPSVSYLLDLSRNVFLQWAEEENSQLERTLLVGREITAPSLQSGHHVPGFGLFFREHPENEAAILVRLKGWGNYGVLPRRKFEAVTHFSGVDERATHGHSSLSQQDIWTEVNVAAAFELKMTGKLHKSLSQNSLYLYSRYCIINDNSNTLNSEAEVSVFSGAASVYSGTPTSSGTCKQEMTSILEYLLTACILNKYQI